VYLAHIRRNISNSLKRQKSFNLFPKHCPKCGSTNTKINRWSVDNLKLGLAWVILILFTVVPGGSFNRVCRECGHMWS
jgi:hypothetical protein